MNDALELARTAYAEAEQRVLICQETLDKARDWLIQNHAQFDYWGIVAKKRELHKLEIDLRKALQSRKAKKLKLEEAEHESGKRF